VKAAPRCSERDPEEGILRGDRASSRLTASPAAADRRPEKALKARSSALTSRGNSRQEPTGNDRRARNVDEALRLGGGNKPLRGESRTWLWDETSPRGAKGRKPSRA
jgi:hypothetical protein